MTKEIELQSIQSILAVHIRNSYEKAIEAYKTLFESDANYILVFEMIGHATLYSTVGRAFYTQNKELKNKEVDYCFDCLMVFLERVSSVLEGVGEVAGVRSSKKQMDWAFQVVAEDE
ncbi:hypothetical protein [Sporosarcina sp. P29]|uniref:hypothetical protein n=1 Tax=Sporosarcina sp. P29 TaxID=2048252 RepID=UPI000C16FC5B|nr:hypothetical protein [Sporosarcina sp. P29]PIC99612.1 hypothetical protein CSV68_07670 [Sporosarcina sp. P29]